MKLKRMAGAAAVLLLLAVCTGALAADTGIITADGVNLRESPDKESNAIGTLELGSEVEVLAVENGWYRIMLKSGTVGYIRQDYIFSNSSGRQLVIRYALTPMGLLISLREYSATRSFLLLQSRRPMEGESCSFFSNPSTAER